METIKTLTLVFKETSQKSEVGDFIISKVDKNGLTCGFKEKEPHTGTRHHLYVVDTEDNIIASTGSVGKDIPKRLINEFVTHYNMGVLVKKIKVTFENNEVKSDIWNTIEASLILPETELLPHWEELFRFISSESSARESIFVEALIDKIAEIRGVSKEQNKKDFTNHKNNQQ